MRAWRQRPWRTRAPSASSRGSFRTEFGGLFLFIPLLVALALRGGAGPRAVAWHFADPAVHAIRALLALKLFGRARHRHVMPSVFDEGLALFAGLNAIPKRSFLTEYSCRIERAAIPSSCNTGSMRWAPVGIERGESFHLDFPYHPVFTAKTRS